MAASVVQICNLALSHLGAAAIVSLTERSAEAMACALHFEPCRDSVLRDYPWNFATKRVVLAERSGEMRRDWGHVYSLPSDCLLARDLLPDAPFVIESNDQGTTRLLLTHQPQARLLYTARVEEPTLYDPLFVEALAWKLAVQICMPLTRDKNSLQLCQSLYLNTLSLAQRADGNEGQDDRPPEAEWILARQEDTPCR